MKQQKVAIISDTHGHIDDNIIEIIKDCDQVIHAGDICGAHVLEQLAEISDKVTAVTGNNDAPGLWAEEETEVVSQLPRTATIELPGGSVAVEHGHIHGMHQPEHELLRQAHPEARVIIYGHTHSMVIDDDQRPWVVNPGAAGATRTRGGPSCLVLTALEEGEWDIQMIRFHDEQVA